MSNSNIGRLVEDEEVISSEPVDYKVLAKGMKTDDLRTAIDAYFNNLSVKGHFIRLFGFGLGFPEDIKAYHKELKRR